jgi:NAD(P)-dependent dehydrogenase (short-subunit alcohol dehydrogenase family)
MNLDIKDLRVLVTAGANGIGLEIARSFVQEGARVHVCDVDDAALEALKHSDPKITQSRCDVADRDQVATLFKTATGILGGLDALVNNAGIAGGYGGVEVVHEAMLARLFAVNVGGAFLCAREAAARMRTDRGGKGGCICNISSKAAVIGGSGEWVHYAATKGAIDTMTVGLARELAAHGVRVNGVRPGLIVSDFHDHAAPGRLERMAPQIPMLRSGSADEVAAAVVWLNSPAASYVTGAFVDVAGGR